jgi:hypothetical protein
MGTMNAAPSGQSKSQWSGQNSNHQWSGNNSNHQWSGGNFDRHGSHHRGHHRGNFAFGFYDGGYYNDYAYDYDAGCYRMRHVRTHHGWRWRRVYVCD